MISETRKTLRTAIKLLVILIIFTGFLYPLLITSLAQLFFPWKANGSLLKVGEKTVGSRWIGQSFTQDQYFWGRPSETKPYPYHATASNGSNAAASDPAFLKRVQERVKALQKNNPQNASNTPIPVDLVTASGSGLDPEISPRAAFYQVARVAKARKEKEEKIRALVQSFIKARSIGILGEPRISVLELNLALDQLIVHRA